MNGVSPREFTWRVCGCPVGCPPPFQLTAKEWYVNPVEYKPARYIRFRKVLMDVAVGVVSNLLVAAATAAAHLLF
ncbi:hypothetical protein B046DRAFT_04247 [Streptomyces sp. LamerLS-316]|nr:DUF6408 family protein [Streptomyces sp. SID4921]SCK43175.1 hypothetical protein B046DRAFT_04247 [Streptomyces sp. LamerLS-316]